MVDQAGPCELPALVKFTRGVPLEVQSQKNECGLACLAMVAGYFDADISLAGMRRRFPVLANGGSVADLARAAQETGFVARGLRADLDDLKVVRLPAILHVDLNHFVVLIRVTRRRCVIHDPANGREDVAWPELSRRFTGVVLEIAPGEIRPVEVPAHPTLTLGDIIRLLPGRRRYFAWAVALSLLVQAMVLAGPWQMQWTVDEALVRGDEHLISVLAVSFATLVVLRVAASWLRGVLVIHLGQARSFQLACALLQHLLRLPLSWYVVRSSGDVLSRFSSISPVRDFLTQGAAALLVDSFMVLMSCVVMLIYSPALTLLVVAAHTLFIALYLAAVPRLRRLGLSGVQAEAREQTHLLESLRQISSVKAAVMESRRLSQWQKHHARTVKYSIDLQRTHLLAGTAGQFLTGLELVALVFLGAHQVLSGALTVGMLFAFVSFRGHFADRTASAVALLTELRTLRVHQSRLGEIWNEEPEQAAAHLPLLEKAQPVHLRKITFSHDKRHVLLREIDLIINPGELVVLFGPSGAGKSTLLKILMGLLSPDHGSVNVGSEAVDGQASQRYRRQSASVLQEDRLFAGSIGENITLYGRVNEERLGEVLLKAGIGDEIERLPLGLETQVGDMDSGISSGQTQRILLARALYRDPLYLFLDEGTANLDPVSTARVQASVRGLSCTRVVVTHDTGFARIADRVLTLNEGRLRELDPARYKART